MASQFKNKYGPWALIIKLNQLGGNGAFESGSHSLSNCGNGCAGLYRSGKALPFPSSRSP